jgi:hypothetical protein
MADDHLIALVEEGDLAVIATGLEHHPQCDDEMSHLGDPPVRPGERRGPRQLENHVGAHRSADHVVVTAAERGEELGEETLAVGVEQFVTHVPQSMGRRRGFTTSAFRGHCS